MSRPLVLASHSIPVTVVGHHNNLITPATSLRYEGLWITESFGCIVPVS